MKIFVDASPLIYLNVPMPEEQAKLIESFWKSLLSEHEVFTNLLVLDEVIYVSKRKYGVKQEETLNFIERTVLPHIELLSIGAELYSFFRLYMMKFNLKPSDALHAATVKRYKLDAIASEDKDFDRAGIRRIWL
ncbi:MAG: type II toxin-antitoxin system VapC family toxin [archaeon YNP-LCB-003-016]|jgi:predicted nucleic acid-binding protein|uniref:type II toxin-antitoxin system VapC family toxin n=1 Tax=Candidatus Culexarchaeum yellowstonense TaxID=2928963 RepID=UPI0026EC97F1|nr:type II toxin-antitoxin system VapC family toxin [Candidatus Culexarchaeum yellowstonense]MCR6624541.1 type II toxin-antitoxin system VapC family toxin [Candidatus Culexarchaeum yellowstonense]MCR6692500.1 type II toxin-antitoxin system VapC family toxin [Candidatus Culexarchaeum yellowstonense]